MSFFLCNLPFQHFPGTRAKTINKLTSGSTKGPTQVLVEEPDGDNIFIIKYVSRELNVNYFKKVKISKVNINKMASVQIQST